MIHRILVGPELSWAYIVVGFLLACFSVWVEDRLSRPAARGGWPPREVPHLGMLGLRAVTFYGALMVAVHWLLLARPEAFRAQSGMADDVWMAIHARNFFGIAACGFLALSQFMSHRRSRALSRGASMPADFSRDFEHPGNGTEIYDDLGRRKTHHPNGPHHRSRVK